MSVRGSILLATMVAVLACGGGDDGNGGNGGQGPGETPDGDVLVRNDFFEPATIEAAAGGTVVWAWASNGRAHNVTFDDGPTSNNRSSGTYERTFAAAGTYPYHCTIHGTATSGMRGAVTVAATGGGTGGGGGGGGGGDGPGPSPGY